jgi:CHAD domain-containing protein
VWRLYDAVLAYDEVLSDTPEPEILHHFRNACRALRSGLKIFGTDRAAVKPVTRELHEVQRQLGRYHDHVLAIEQLNKWTAAKKLTQTAELRELKRWHRDEADRLRGRFQTRWLRLFERRFRAQLFRALELEARPRESRTRLRAVPDVPNHEAAAAPVAAASAG